MVVLGTTIHEFLATLLALQPSYAHGGVAVHHDHRRDGTLYIGVTTAIAERGTTIRGVCLPGSIIAQRNSWVVGPSPTMTIESAVRTSDSTSA
jgi:hypothetical protein